MIEKPMDVLHQHPVRKSRKQKKSFREEVLRFAKTIGYDATVEKGSFGSQNVIWGDPAKAKYLVTAHYDTPARLPFPNLITPCNFWTFMGYQLFQCVVILAFVAVIAALASLIFKDSLNLMIAVDFGMLLCLYLLLLGPANKNNANDNTSGVVTVLEIAKNLPEACRDQVCFVLFDMEEQGLLGSFGYAGKHKKEIKNQIILNLDCVGDGDAILMIPTGKLKKNTEKMDMLRRLTGSEGKKSLILHEKGFSIYPSDQANFPYGVAFSAMLRSKSGILYCDKIHTNKDTILEEENVRILSDRICNVLKNLAQKEMKGEVVHD